MMALVPILTFVYLILVLLIMTTLVELGVLLVEMVMVMVVSPEGIQTVTQLAGVSEDIDSASAEG